MLQLGLHLCEDSRTSKNHQLLVAVFEGPRGEMSCKDWAQDVIGLTAQSCSPAWLCTCHHMKVIQDDDDSIHYLSLYFMNLSDLNFGY